MKRKIYFAGHSSQWQQVQTWIEGAKELGHTVTFDWTAMVAQHGRGSVEHTPREVLIEAAVKDTQGVVDADLFVLFGHEGLYGAMAELGMALATETEVWIVENPPRYSVFFDHPLCTVVSYVGLRERLEYETF